MADKTEIGRLRWLVTIARRDQAPSIEDAGVTETLVPVATARADIQPIGALTFWSAQQTDTPVTHRITMRWLDYIDNRHVILRQTGPIVQQTSPATDPYRQSSTRTEVFRVRRVKEVAGRKRFIEVEAELESAR